MTAHISHYTFSHLFSLLFPFQLFRQIILKRILSYFQEVPFPDSLLIVVYPANNRIYSLNSFKYYNLSCQSTQIQDLIEYGYQGILALKKTYFEKYEGNPRLT